MPRLVSARSGWAYCLLLLGFLLSETAAAQSSLLGEENLLPVEQAFKLRAEVVGDEVRLHWSIAPNYYLYRGRLHFSASQAKLGTPQLPPGKRYHDPYLGEVETYHYSLDARLPYAATAAGDTLELAVQYQGCHETDPKICYPPHTEHLHLPRVISAAPTAGGAAPNTAAAAPPWESLLKTAEPIIEPHFFLLLLAALGGGLLLNLLPCVLPVLALKVLGVLAHGEQRRQLKRHALGYALGVLASFAAIDLLAHSLGRGLGAQLQTSWIVGALACIMLLVGLNLSGLGSFGTRFSGVGQGLISRGGWMGDFFTGVLAVVVAAPCTGPLMGPPVAYAFTAPLLPSLTVFLALGLGLALPLLLVAWLPGAARLLPRPSRWMETFKQLLAFPMYLSAAWLVWVLAKQRGADAVGLVLVAGVLMAMALWWSGRSRERRLVWRLPTLILGLVALLPLYALTRLPATAVTTAQQASDSSIVAYTPQRLAELRRSGRPVLVDMTADWCVTCKANEHTVLSGTRFQQLLKRTGTVYMQGDWTNVNPVIADFLHRYHSPGVPLYVVFPAHGGPGQVLPTVLTPALLRDALNEASH